VCVCKSGTRSSARAEFIFDSLSHSFKENDHLQGKGLGHRFWLIRSLRAARNLPRRNKSAQSRSESDAKPTLFLARPFHARFQLRLSIIKGTRQSFFVCHLDADRPRSVDYLRAFLCRILDPQKCLSERTGGSATDLNPVPVVPWWLAKDDGR